MRILIIVVLTIFLFSCPGSQSDLDDNPTEESPWTIFGLEGHEIRRLRLFGDQLYSITKQRSLYRLNIRSDLPEWEHIEFEYLSHEGYGVKDVYTHPDNEDKILLSFSSPDSSLPTLFSSEDFGVTWLPIDSGLVMEDNSHLLPYRLIGSGNRVYSTSYHHSLGMILSSNDFGNTWNKLRAYSDADYTVAAVHPQNDSLLWYRICGVYGCGSIRKSLDGGKTSDQQISQPHYCEFYGFDLIVHPQDMDMVYLTCDARLIKSKDGGLTWEYFWIDSLFYPEIYYSESLFIDNSSTNHLFMSGTYSEVIGNWEDVLYKKRLFESWDEGETWEEIDIPDTINSNYDFTSKPAFDHTSQTFYFPTQTGVLKYKLY